MFSTSGSNRRSTILLLAILATFSGIGCSQAPPPLKSEFVAPDGLGSTPFLVVRYIELSKNHDPAKDPGELVAIAIWSDLTAMKVASMNLYVTRLTVGRIDRAQLDHLESEITRNWNDLRKLEKAGVPYDMSYRTVIYRSTFGRRYQFATWEKESAAGAAAERLAQDVRQLIIRNPKSTLTDREPIFLN